jgi:hypothetical protein
LGSPNSQNYSYLAETGVPVGPYPGTLTGSSLLFFYCMDMALPANWNTAYNGSDANPTTQVEEEAAFLATLEMFDGGSSSNQTFVNQVEGPISLAIWELFGNMGSYPNDPAADQYIQQAQYAWNHLLNNPQNTPAQVALVQNWLAQVLIFTPNPSGTQRFLGAYQDNALVLAAQPEPGTIILFLTGLGLVALGRIRQPKWLPSPSHRQRCRK